MNKRGTIALAGALAQKPGRGGHTWVFLQYLLGLRRLGWDVLFLDHLEPEMCVEAQGRRCRAEDSAALRYLLEVVRGFGLGDAFSVRIGDCVVGLSQSEVIQRVRQSALLLNVMGFCNDESILEAAPRRVFLDIDPGFGQMWRELKLTDVFRGHDTFVTIGENIGRAECDIPTCGLAWITSPQPVVLDAWPRQEGSGGPITSVASWRGAFGPVEYGSKIYGQRVHEFRKFAALPQRWRARFELALDIHEADRQDLQLLQTSGWTLVDPRRAAADPWAYRTYLQQSQAEFMVAKSMYVQTASGWFSDRSLCYLASGRPVLAQDTGWTRHYPSGEGLLAFTSLDDAVAGVEAITGHYSRHARAARVLAEEYFDSDKVLSRLLAKLGVA